MLSRFRQTLAPNAHVDDVTTRVVCSEMKNAFEVFVEAGAMLADRMKGDKELDFPKAKSNLSYQMMRSCYDRL